MPLWKKKKSVWVTPNGLAAMRIGETSGAFQIQFMPALYLKWRHQCTWRVTFGNNLDIMSCFWINHHYNDIVKYFSQFKINILICFTADCSHYSSLQCHMILQLQIPYFTMTRKITKGATKNKRENTTIEPKPTKIGRQHASHYLSWWMLSTSSYHMNRRALIFNVLTESLFT